MHINLLIKKIARKIRGADLPYKNCASKALLLAKIVMYTAQ